MITLKQLKDKLHKDFGWENLESDDNKWFVDNLLKDTIQAIEVIRCCDKLPQDPVELARYLHDNYEMIAKKQNWNTQENCKVDFSDLPVGNKNTMILLAGKLILDFGGN